MSSTNQRTRYFSLVVLAAVVPFTGGTGLHPPSQACDFARHCSSLDFWSINDHAEGLTPRRWDETKKSVRECKATPTSAPRRQKTVWRRQTNASGH